MLRRRQWLSGARPSRQVPDEELDEVFADKRVSDIGAEYDEDGDDDGEPHEAGGMTFEDIDLAMRTVKKPKATKEERRHAGMVFCDMKGNELFAMIEKSSEATRRKLDELMDYYLDGGNRAGSGHHLAVDGESDVGRPQGSARG